MVLTLAAIIVVLLLLTTLLVLARLSSVRRDCGLDIPSAEQYDRVLWLLADERLRLLRSHGAHEREKRIRLRRYQIVRHRLKSLNQDFRRISTALKTVMVQSERDRPELASRLIRAQIQFSFQMLVVRFRLLQFRWDFGQRN